MTIAAVYIREVFNFGLTGLILTARILAVVKLVIAVAFTAYLIELARAVVTRQEPNRETVDVVLLLALVTITFWAVPALTQGNVALLRVEATEFLLLVGAAVVIMIERHVEPLATTSAQPLAETGARPAAELAAALSASFSVSPVSSKG